MKKKIKIAIVVVVLILGLLILGVYIISNNKNENSSISQEFLLDEDYKYKVRTEAIVFTSLQDGGTHYDVYYEIDLKAKTIEKREDYVYASLSATSAEKETESYERKLLASEKLSHSEVKELKNLFDNKIATGNVETDYYWEDFENLEEIYKYYYTLSQYDEEITMSKEETDEFLEIISSSIEEE